MLKFLLYVPSDVEAVFFIHCTLKPFLSPWLHIAFAKKLVILIGDPAPPHYKVFLFAEACAHTHIQHFRADKQAWDLSSSSYNAEKEQYML